MEKQHSAPQAQSLSTTQPKKKWSQGSTTTQGWYDFNVGQNYTVYSQMNGGTGVYTENDYYIVVQKTSTSNLCVRVIFRDQDAGDQTGSGAPVDENVNGNLTCSVQYQKAITNVVGPTPSFSIASGSSL